jgi:serine/threonine-protein phosphatase 6 regulatory ankyrin repeat subunit B
MATALHIAVCTANTAAVMNLLDLGVPIEAYTPTGNTPLLLAAQRGFTSLVRTLITERAADVNAKDEFGGTSLHFAAQNGFADIVRLIIDAEGGGESIIACDYAGNTPITIAVKNEHVQIVKELLQTHFQNLDVRSNRENKSEAGWETPHEEDERMENVNEDINIDDVSEANVQNRHTSNSDVDMESEAELFELELLSRNMALRVRACVEAAKKGFIEIVQILVGELFEGALLSESKDGFTPLHWAAKCGFPDVAKLLCKEYPALLNAADNEARLTPLHLACYYGQKAVVNELLVYGPDLSLLDSVSFLTPFAAACNVAALDVIQSLLPALSFSFDDESTNFRDLGLNEAARYARKEVAEYLLDHGGSPNAIDKYANAALHWAAWNSDCRLI